MKYAAVILLTARSKLWYEDIDYHKTSINVRAFMDLIQTHFENKRVQFFKKKNIYIYIYEAIFQHVSQLRLGYAHEFRSSAVWMWSCLRVVWVIV